MSHATSTPGRRIAEFIVVVTKVAGWLIFLGATIASAVTGGAATDERIFVVVLGAIAGMVTAWLGRVVFYIVTGEKRPW